MGEIVIDSWIIPAGGEELGALCVVDISEGSGYVFGSTERQDEYIVRIDAEGRDASRSSGEEGVDWEYMHVAADEAVVA